MLDFKENIELLEKVILNFIITPDDADYVIKPKNATTLDKREILSLVKSFYFLDDRYQEIIRVTKQYFKDFSRLPSRSEIRGMLNLRNTRFTDKEIDEVFAIDLKEYSYHFLYKYTEAFILYRNFNASMTEMITDLKTKDITPDNIDTVINKARNDIYTKLNITLKNTSQGLDFFNPESHIQLPKTGNPTGFAFFDKTLGGGWNPKTLVVFQGRPKVGKTLVLANIAGRAVLRGVNVGVATYEVSKQVYTKRIGANILSIPYADYDRFIKKTDLSVVNQRLAALKASNPNIGSLHIEDFFGSALDIENHFLKIEQQTGKKFGIIVVDYLNLVKPIKDKEGLYEKIKVISEELRAIAIRNEWCLITATQVKREAVGSNDMGMEDVAESFGLIHTVDSLFGLMRQPLEKIMKIKLIANRDGGYTESFQRYDINYNHARLVETTSPADVYYSDDDQAAELEADMINSYARTTPTIEDELRGLLVSNQPPAEESFETPIEDAPFDPDEETNLLNGEVEQNPVIDSSPAAFIAEFNDKKRAEKEEARKIGSGALQLPVQKSSSIFDDLDSIAESQPTSNFKKTSEYDDILNSL